uniref:Uncharacterized protein n=1 Tax=Strongyloides papillosus TaxID=174720 RepID=A0A0N5B327_STREA
MEMGNYTQYVLTKPFVELGIKKNLRDVKALVSQIEEKLLPYLTQDFDQSKRPKRSPNVAAQPGLDKAADDYTYPVNKKRPIEEPKQFLPLISLFTLLGQIM